jgi:hypothetical protein
MPERGAKLSDSRDSTQQNSGASGIIALSLVAILAKMTRPTIIIPERMDSPSDEGMRQRESSNRLLKGY